MGLKEFLKDFGETKWWKDFTIAAVIVCIVIYYGAYLLGYKNLATAMSCALWISILLFIIVFVIPFVSKKIKKA